MRAKAVLARISREVRSWMDSAADALPPYRHAEGRLQGKVLDADRPCIVVGGQRVEVDRNTFELLAIGERIRVRYTRGGKAINIDRLVPRGNSQ